MRKIFSGFIAGVMIFSIAPLAHADIVPSDLVRDVCNDDLSPAKYRQCIRDFRMKARARTNRRGSEPAASLYEGCSQDAGHKKFRDCILRKKRRSRGRATNAATRISRKGTGRATARTRAPGERRLRVRRSFRRDAAENAAELRKCRKLPVHEIRTCVMNFRQKRK
jgi:hypothetical protein